MSIRIPANHQGSEFCDGVQPEVKIDKQSKENVAVKASDLKNLQHLVEEKEGLIRELRKKELLLNMIFDHAPINIYVKDNQGRFLAVNRQFEKSFKIRTDELIGASNIAFLGQTEQAQANIHDRKVLESGESSSQAETIGNRVYHVIKHPIFDEAGNATEIIGFDVDITDLESSRAELEDKYKELEAFSVTVVHDLKAPLRRIHGFVDLLRDEYGPGMDRTALEYLEVIGNSALNLETLIADLLQLSRLGAGDPDFTEIDLGALLLSVRKGLPSYDGYAPERVVTLQDGLPVLEGNRAILGVVFQNLLDNALKFSRPKVAPAVTVAASRSGDDWLFSVRDNGIGIPPEKREDVFEIFKRLHDAEHYAGNGVGLAIVRKGVRRHHGEVWVEAAPDQGSIFYLRLPARQPVE